VVEREWGKCTHVKPCGIAGIVRGLNAQLAWAYVVLRVSHSFVQATRNVIPVRFENGEFAFGRVVH